MIFKFSISAAPTACGGTAGPATQPPATTQKPKTCAEVGGVPNWVKDKYCDNENNNAECQYDGGDCCGNTMANWDWYCKVWIPVIPPVALLGHCLLYTQDSNPEFLV